MRDVQEQDCQLPNGMRVHRARAPANAPGAGSSHEIVRLAKVPAPSGVVGDPYPLVVRDERKSVQRGVPVIIYPDKARSRAAGIAAAILGAGGLLAAWQGRGRVKRFVLSRFEVLFVWPSRLR
jgi:hypothetical protein